MQDDFSTYLGHVERTVTECERDGKPARSITLERTYDTTPGDLWDAITSPERLPRWFMPVSGDLQLNGRYQFEGNAGGVITTCDPPRHLAATWEMGAGTSWVEVSITPVGPDQCRLTLSHICPFDDHFKKYGPGAVGIGWELGLVGLTVHLTNAESERFDEERFASSTEGKTFMTSSSLRWRQAAVAAGEDLSVAVAAEKLTTAFYTGEESED